MGGAYVDARRFCPRSFLPFRNGGRRRISAALRGSASYARLKRVPGAILPACSHRLRQALHRRNREVGQGDQVRGHQAGMTLAVAKPFHLRPASTAGCKRRRILATAHLTISAMTAWGQICRARARAARQLCPRFLPDWCTTASRRSGPTAVIVQVSTLVPLRSCIEYAA
jgi:hypothetical protein